MLLHVFEDTPLNQYLRFKGGTSLSKCYGVIERFSEDIYLLLDWTQLTEEDPTDSERSKTQQNNLNQSINEDAVIFIANTTIPLRTNSQVRQREELPYEQSTTSQI